MFDIGLQEMLVVGVLALLVFGPSKLPELGRMFGRAMREFRRASDEFRSTVETNLKINEPEPFIEPTMVDASPPLETVPPTASTEVTSGTGSSFGDVPVAEVAGESSEPFCARRGARLVHRRECPWAARIPAPDRIEFKRLEEATAERLSPCPVCEPSEVA